MSAFNFTPTNEVIWGALGTIGTIALGGFGWGLKTLAVYLGDLRYVQREKYHNDVDIFTAKITSMELAIGHLVTAEAISREIMGQFAAVQMRHTTTMETLLVHVASIDGWTQAMREKGAIRIINDASEM